MRVGFERALTWPSLASARSCKPGFWVRNAIRARTGSDRNGMRSPRLGSTPPTAVIMMKREVFSGRLSTLDRAITAFAVDVSKVTSRVFNTLPPIQPLTACVFGESIV